MSFLSIKGVVWQSQITDEMVAHLSDNEISLLSNTLNDAVQEIFNNYEIN